MNNFDAVFTVVQKHCSKQETLTGMAHLQKIAAEAGIPIERMPFYLESLSDLGLIHYSIADRMVSLTTKGETTSFVFAESLGIR